MLLLLLLLECPSLLRLVSPVRKSDPDGIKIVILNQNLVQVSLYLIHYRTCSKMRSGILGCRGGLTPGRLASVHDCSRVASAHRDHHKVFNFKEISNRQGGLIFLCLPSKNGFKRLKRSVHGNRRQSTSYCSRVINKQGTTGLRFSLFFDEEKNLMSSWKDYSIKLKFGFDCGQKSFTDFFKYQANKNW
jgi:hypothetical protein